MKQHDMQKSWFHDWWTW